MRTRRRRGWKERGNYLVRTKKPHAPLGLPVIGRHNGYVGQSGSRYHRDRQHKGLDPRNAPSPWSDLEPRWYALPSLPWWKWSRELSERMWIALLCPAYNVQGQAPWNLRRISKASAMRARAARDARRLHAPGRQLVVDILVTCARLVIGTFAIAVAAVLIMKAR